MHGYSKSALQALNLPYILNILDFWSNFRTDKKRNKPGYYAVRTAELFKILILCRTLWLNFMIWYVQSNYLMLSFSQVRHFCDLCDIIASIRYNYSMSQRPTQLCQPLNRRAKNLSKGTHVQSIKVQYSIVWYGVVWFSVVQCSIVQ